MGTNDDLIPALNSETFRNFAHKASSTYGVSSITNEAEGPQTVTFSYDASLDSYTVSVPGRSTTFTAADLSSPGNYRRVTGSVTESLGLTRPGQSGTGALTYRYVGAGFWRRQTVNSSNTAGSIDAFVYGVPSVSRPSSGSAAYAIEVIGSINEPDLALLDHFYGDGVLLVDFATGSLRGAAEFFIQRPDGSPYSIGSQFDGTVAIDADISANGPTFSGTVKVLTFGDYDGTLAGGFFGPNQQDIGASFSATSEQGHVLIGTLLGTKNDSLNVLPLDKLEKVTHFNGLFGGSYSDTMAYDPQAQTYTIPTGFTGPLGELTFGPAQLAASQDDDTFIKYNVAGNGHQAQVLLYRLGSDNADVELTYSRIARLVFPSGDPDVNVGLERDVLFGSRTPTGLLPRRGAATYQGFLYGQGVEFNGPGDSTADEYFAAEGSATFVADFASFRVDVDLHPILTSLTDGSVIDFGVHSGWGQLERGEAKFNGVFDNDGTTSLTGYFFGPDGEEIGAGFALREYDSGAFRALHVLGVAVGARVTPP